MACHDTMAEQPNEPPKLPSELLIRPRRARLIHPPAIAPSPVQSLGFAVEAGFTCCNAQLQSSSHLGGWIPWPCSPAQYVPPPFAAQNLWRSPLAAGWQLSRQTFRSRCSFILAAQQRQPVPLCAAGAQAAEATRQADEESNVRRCGRLRGGGCRTACTRSAALRPPPSLRRRAPGGTTALTPMPSSRTGTMRWALYLHMKRLLMGILPRDKIILLFWCRSPGHHFAEWRRHRLRAPGAILAH